MWSITIIITSFPLCLHVQSSLLINDRLSILEHQYNHVIPQGSLTANHTRSRLFQFFQNPVKCYQPIKLLSSSTIPQHTSTPSIPLHTDTPTCVCACACTHTHALLSLGKIPPATNCPFLPPCFCAQTTSNLNSFLPLCLSKYYPCSKTQTKVSNLGWEATQSTMTMHFLLPGTRPDTEYTIRKTTQPYMLLTGGRGFNINLPAHFNCAGRGVND